LPWPALGCIQPERAPAPISVPAGLSGELHYARFAASATLVPTGKVLIADGIVRDSGAAAELYDPTAGGFLLTGRMLNGRAYHTATSLTDGRVLLASGIGTSSAPIGEAELYDSVTGRFEPAGNMLDARFNHTATLLLNGKVLITGGELTSGL
jgi:hypothetical protein